MHDDEQCEAKRELTDEELGRIKKALAEQRAYEHRLQPALEAPVSASGWGYPNPVTNCHNALNALAGLMEGPLDVPTVMAARQMICLIRTRLDQTEQRLEECLDKG